MLDTSVLINFLVLDRFALLRSAAAELIATDHVRSEITEDFPTQLERLDLATDAGLLKIVSVVEVDEMAAFASLAESRVLGAGECSAIAHAGSRGHALAMDDRRARSRARAIFPDLDLWGTADITLAAIHRGVLKVDEADHMKADWERRFRFKLPFESFADSVNDRRT